MVAVATGGPCCASDGLAVSCWERQNALVIAMVADQGWSGRKASVFIQTSVNNGSV